LQLQSENKEQFIAYLKSIDRLDEAAIHLADIINNEEFISRDGKSKHQVVFSSKLVIAISLRRLILNIKCLEFWHSNYSYHKL